MARPQKEGLDYFPLDVDVDQDDKVTLIEAQYGIEGFGIVIKLMMKIYKTSYFYEWTEREQLLFSKRVNVDINRVNAVINNCVKWGLFDETVYNLHKVLTSKGIQKRYLTAIGRRQTVKMIKEYLLLDDETVNAYKNLVIVNINPIKKELMPTLIPKGKERKEKETKEKERKEEIPSSPPLSFPTPLHNEIFGIVGEIAYRTWFIDSTISDGEEIVIGVKSEFMVNVIIDKFKDNLEKLFNKKIEVEIREDV
ncbi:DUF4373 domain-containing protein [Clostridium culturomicium]|uniref:DUF4373 domain-containing protein n=1 Tax=Clostridium culturomicium TaxID=1499683 RepID=UPI0009DF8C52|nr:DUF4373 domain-containing protein [Clostridium culturomicium]